HRLLRGADGMKDQSYVLYVLGQEQLARCRFPVGELTKAEVRRRAAALGLRTAAEPDSVEVCFVTASGGRPALLGSRIALHRASATAGGVVVRFDEPHRRVAPGQSVVLYRGDEVLGGGVAA